MGRAGTDVRPPFPGGLRLSGSEGDRSAARDAGPWLRGLAFLTLGVLALWRALAGIEGSGGDAHQYLAHAWALVEGRPYADTGYLYHPGAWLVGPPLQPPGLPLTLAPLLALLGRYSAAPGALMYGFLAAFLAATYARLRRTEPASHAVGATLMAGSALLLIDATDSVGSDLGYMALVWTALWIADGPSGGLGRWAGAAAAGCGAMMYRLAAIPLVPAGVLWCFLDRKRRRPLWGWLAVVVVWAGCFSLLYWGLGFGQTPGGRLRLGSGAGETGAAQTILSHARDNIAVSVPSYRYGVMQALLYPFPADTANDVYHVIAGLLAGAGLILWGIRAHRTLLFAFTVSTAAFLGVVPVFTGRYLWVAYPVLALGFIRALSEIARRCGARTPGRAALVTVFALVIMSSATRYREEGGGSRSPPVDPPRALWAWAAALLQEDAGPSTLRIVSNRPRTLAWFGDLPAAYAEPGDTATFRALAATHAVFDRRAWLSDGRRGSDPEREVDGWAVLARRGSLTVLRKEGGEVPLTPG